MKLFNLYATGRLGVLDTTPVVYAFRNAPRNCHRSTHSVHFASSLNDFREKHLPIINNYGAANSVVTAYLLRPKEVERGFKELGTSVTELDTAEGQANVLQCAYFLVLKPAIDDSYEVFVKNKNCSRLASPLDRIMEPVF